MKAMPSTIGDVLILETHQTFTLYAVGLIAEDGQQDFGDGHTNISHVTDITSAVAAARSMLVAGHRIFRRNMDTGEWTRIPG